jgi:Tfp pilus assembly protein PilO
MELPKINLPPIQTKYKVVVAIGACVLLMGMYYDHAYKPHAKKIFGFEQDMLLLDDTIKVIRNMEYPNAKNLALVLQKIENKKNGTAAAIAVIENTMPRRAELSKILETITHLAYESGCEIKSLEPKDFTQKEAYNSMTLYLDINTRYANLLIFLESLKKYWFFPNRYK